MSKEISRNYITPYPTGPNGIRIVELSDGVSGEMDTKTPHGRAQALFDEFTEVSGRNGGIPVHHEATENGSASLDLPKKTEPKKALPRNKDHDLKNFSGWFRGIYYRNGIPNKRK